MEAASSSMVDSHGHVDLLLNCTGILHPTGRGETSLAAVNSQVSRPWFSISSLSLFWSSFELGKYHFLEESANKLA